MTGKLGRAWVGAWHGGGGDVDVGMCGVVGVMCLLLKDYSNITRFKEHASCYSV